MVKGFYVKKRQKNAATRREAGRLSPQLEPAEGFANYNLKCRRTPKGNDWWIWLLKNKCLHYKQSKNKNDKTGEIMSKLD